MPDIIITLASATEIKAAIWGGEPQGSVAARFGVTQPTISRICSGKQWSDAPWPDGTKGGLSIDKKRELHRLRFSGVRATAVAAQLAKLGSMRPGAIAAALSSLGAETEEDSSQELISKVLDTAKEYSVSGEPEEAAEETEDKSPEMAYSEHEWLEIKARAPDNLLVKWADLLSDLERAAVTTVFKNIPEEQWAGPMAERLVKSVMKEMGNG